MQRSRAEPATAQPGGGGELLIDAGQEMKKGGVLQNATPGNVVQALGSGRVGGAAVDLTAFLAQLHDSVETCLLLLQQISARAECRMDDIERLALQSGTCRVAGYLLGQLPPGRDEYALKVTKGVMASRLAIRAETLSRILKQLSAEGVVSVSSRNIVRVHSRQKLQRLAQETAKPGGPRL